ncbi:MAG: two-component system response regulator [Candidatus Rokuibacteriota bacterium]|nr:MAG: two-component system response regulator [Candidatus Rokubacteria bacterium]
MTAAAPVLLVVDDDQVARELLAETLGRESYRVRVAGGGEEALRLAAAEPFDMALVDLRMPDLDGLAVLKQLAMIQPDLPVVILTAFATVETAIEAVNAGAFDYLSKPFRMEEIKIVVRRTLDARRLARENLQYRQELRARYGFEGLVGQSHQMVEIYKLIARMAALDTTVLIEGETGTGKELVARAIHGASARTARPFVVVDCAALPEALFESELFGHERGAFTGAVAARRGLLETSAGGTCFLDEIGELTAPLQAKLLRTLQEHSIRRVGGNDPIPVDVRVVAATNRDLRRLVADGGFRDDLYYRLNVVTITVPPLRERASDVPLLAQHFLEMFARRSGRAVKRLTPEAVALLAGYRWPGNVRELEHVIERATALSSSDTLLPDDFPPHLREERDRAPRLPADGMTLEDVKRWYVNKVLEESGGNKVRAAELLGIDRRTLYRILERQATEDEA